VWGETYCEHKDGRAAAPSEKLFFSRMSHGLFLSRHVVGKPTIRNLTMTAKLNPFAAAPALMGRQAGAESGLMAMRTGMAGAAASFEPLRPRLVRVAYRMLGSIAHAEDVVQDESDRGHPVETGFNVPGETEEAVAEAYVC
jgi:hypothetical protein